MHSTVIDRVARVIRKSYISNFLSYVDKMQRLQCQSQFFFFTQAPFVTRLDDKTLAKLFDDLCTLLK